MCILVVLVPIVRRHPSGGGHHWPPGHGLHAEGVDALHVRGLQHRRVQHLREVQHEKCYRASIDTYIGDGWTESE